MSWEDVQDAVQEAIVRASRLPPEQVLWSYQSINEAALDHVRINLGGEIAIGIDRIATTTDLTKPVGQEIRQDVRGVREVALEVECFTVETLGSTAARRLAELIRTRIQLDTVRGVLKKAGVSAFDSGPVGWVPDIPNARFRGRALLTIRCYVPMSDCDEYTGYIERVRGTMRMSGFVVASGATGVFATGTRDYSFDSLRASGASGGGP